jgi:multidrug efflux pump subunit AcrA (membrane-fusion protein)
VAFTQQRATNVLAVPTTALLTLADGTFALEVARGASTQLVRVTPGLFAAGGFVSVKGAVKAGDKVVVPQ